MQKTKETNPLVKSIELSEFSVRYSYFPVPSDTEDVLIKLRKLWMK